MTQSCDRRDLNNTHRLEMVERSRVSLIDLVVPILLSL